MNHQQSREFLSTSIQALLEPPKRESISEWMASNFRFPSESSEPGLYNPDRAPYQKEILESISPQSPVRKIILCFGAQMGKTTCELGAMAYYMASYPRPQGFAFSNDGELKSFVKTKFDPMLAANPEIRARLGKGSRSTGDTVNEKLYPGGFLKFISANTEASMRSYSVAVMIGDEIDTYPANVGGNGDPLTQLDKRTNTFVDTRKIVYSSTPANSYSHILQLMGESTYKKYRMKCPGCGQYMTFEFEHFHYSTNKEGKEVTDAWMECPSCGLLIYNRDKTAMMDPKNGAEWYATNPGAPSDNQGYFLPSFYAPVGWLSWTNIAQEHLNAQNAKAEERLFKLVAFHNTVLCRQYNEALDIPDIKALMQRSADSLEKRGIAPSWVSAITTGADVQKNRVEVVVMGWGKRLRHIPIDHYIFQLPPGEEITDIDGTVWKEYYQKIVCGVWEREDGFVLRSVANALDRSYESRIIDNLARHFSSETFYPVRGVSDPKGLSVVPTRKQTRTRRDDTPVVYYDVPVDQLKKVVYRDLVRKEKPGAFQFVEFPDGYAEEFFQQLVSEHLVLNQKTNLEQWEKIRDRNEVLDCFVYSYAMMYLSGLDTLTDEDWEGIAEDQSVQKTQQPSQERARAQSNRRRRVLSSGF